MYSRKIFKIIAALLIQFFLMMDTGWCADGSTLSPRLAVGQAVFSELFSLPEPGIARLPEKTTFPGETSQKITGAREISRVELAVDPWNIFFVGKNGEQEFFLDDDPENLDAPVYARLLADIEKFNSENNGGLESVYQALTRKNEGIFPFWQGMTFRVVVKELMLNAVRAVRESRAQRGKVVVSAAIEGDSVVISFIDDGKSLEPEINVKSGLPEKTLAHDGWEFNGQGWDLRSSWDVDTETIPAAKEKRNLFEAGFTTKQNEWGLNGYGLHDSREFVEKVLGADFPFGEKPRLIVTDNSFSRQEGRLKTFQVIIPLRAKMNFPAAIMLKNLCRRIEGSVIGRDSALPVKQAI